MVGVGGSMFLCPYRDSEAVYKGHVFVLVLFWNPLPPLDSVALLTVSNPVMNSPHVGPSEIPFLDRWPARAASQIGVGLRKRGQITVPPSAPSQPAHFTLLLHNELKPHQSYQPLPTELGPYGLPQYYSPFTEATGSGDYEDDSFDVSALADQYLDLSECLSSIVDSDASSRVSTIAGTFKSPIRPRITSVTTPQSAPMDGNPPPPPPVKLVRTYTRLPRLTIPTLESIRAKGTSSASDSPVAPSPSSALTQISLRAPKRTCWQKMNDVLTTYGFDSLGEFLSVLFYARKRGEKDCRTKSHRQTVAAFLKGQTKITMAHIIPLIYNHHRSRPKRDTAQHSAAFSPSIPLSDIRYARPCLSAWATRLVGDRIYYRVSKLAHKNRSDARNRRHLRATTNKRTNSTDIIEWEDVAFSVEELAALYQEDEFLWHLTECFAASRKGGKVVVKKTRPHPVIQVGAISSFITSRNRYASGDLGLPLGLWLFACQAHIDVKRVLCRFDYSVSESTARNALNTLTDASLNALQEKVRDATVQGEVEYGKISDNVQQYERVFEHGLGKENVLKHGTACTAFGFDDCKPGAFYAAYHIARVIKQERQTMTVENIYSSIDWEHMDNVSDLHFVRVLVDFSPHLNPLSCQVLLDSPLSTNGEQQMENKGYQAGYRDFDKQMGIEPEKSDNLLSWNRADGGGHGMLMRQKMIQVTTKDIYTSYRNAISTPETWHTKSTKLNSAASNHYGPAASPDPSSLSHSSNAANMKRPSDLKKCDFYPTSRSMTLIWEARVLDCWRLVLGCDTDLLAHFDELAANDCLPTLDDLLEQASIIREHYACQTAYEQSLDKEEQDGASSRTKFPQGSTWTPPTSPEASADEPDADADMPGLDEIPDDEEPAPHREAPEPSVNIPITPEPTEPTAKSHEEEGPKIHKELPGFNSDRVLSNAILFLMEFGWWIELNYAIPEGDVGRVFEILKIFIFSFAGSSNQNYMRYMLDLYALLEFECSSELKEALLNNWLINLCGELDKFIEGDLMQEWNNRWLTQTIAPNVLHFLKIKEDMESAFELKRRSKSHTSRHLRDETKILLKLYKDEELHSFRSGRSMGHAAVNQSDRGYQRLEDGKLAEYLEHSAEDANLLREMEVLRGNIPPPTSVRSPDTPSKSNSPTPSSGSSEHAGAHSNTVPSPTPESDRDYNSPTPSSARSGRSSASAASRAAADCVEEWDTIDHSDEPLLSGSDLTVIIDPETGRLNNDWYELEEFEDLLERLCGPEVAQDNDSEDEEPESNDPETESEGEDGED
ncbi:hypothetical protein MVEN_00016000 [Mycena venus]|uniref:DUF6589 domain-containing protein n=1 Tax=Mycena venus TaxID=2733690 RepID=A0A8H7DHI2_9AGAR|nr:hypothetical protein MVEN_00016000 [Mycena venus]